MLSKIINRYNPGVTMLGLIWVVAFALRQFLTERNLLSQTGDEALSSLLYVIPIMLVGWGLLAVTGLIGTPKQDA